MPPLNLAPWEIPEGLVEPPEGCAHAIRSIPWGEGNCDFLFHCIEALPRRWVIFARPLESEDQGNWVIHKKSSYYLDKRCNRNDSVFTEREFLRDDDSAPEVFALRQLRYVEEMVEALCAPQPQNALARLIAVKIEDQQQYALLSSEGFGRWIEPGQTLEVETTFDFSTPPGYMQDGIAALEWLNHQLADSSSEVSFSRIWSELDENQRLELLCGGQENVAEIHDVMRWALQSQCALWEKYDTWYLSLHSNDGHVFSSGADEYQEYREADFPLVFGVARFLVRHHIRRLSAVLRQRYACTKKYPQWYWDDAPDSWTSLEVDAPPTAHEKLEATLSLRQWLRDHASAEEFEAICRHLEP